MAVSARKKLVCGLLVVLALAASSVSAPSGSAQSAGGLQFTDWTSTGGSLATGTLLGRTVTLSGWRLSELGPAYLDGSLSPFSAPYFAPPLPHSDAIEFRAEALAPHSYTLSFGGPTTNPVLHLGSLGTTLEFPSGTSISRLSGKNDGFAVAGSTITGAGDTTVDAYGLNDSNGTVRLNGTFSSITFTATTAYAVDGILLQVGAPLPPEPSPTPGPPEPSPTPTPPPTPPRATVSIHVTGIEVTQGIQEDHCAGCIGTLPSRDETNPNRSGHAAYRGVRMAAGHFTVVRVFAKLDAAASIASLRNPTARLVVMDAFNRQIALLSPDSSPVALYRSGSGFGSCAFCVRLEERANETRSFNFLIPWQQTFRRTLNFRAIVRPPVGPGLPRQCASCSANVFDLTGVPFVPTADVRIHPIQLTVNNARTEATENQIFGTAQAVLPVNLQVLPYERLPLAVDGMDSDQAAAAVAKRAGEEGLDSAQYPIGVFVEPTPNLGGLTLGGRVLYQSTPASIVRDNRPLTSIMHEIGHGLGLVHADTGSFVAGGPTPGFTGPHPDGTDDCGGNSGRQIGESWPPDDKGRIRGVGLDRRNWDVFRTGSWPRTIVEGFPYVTSEYYDFMSYCGKEDIESTHWISVRNWNRLLDFHPPAPARAAAVRARAAVAGGRQLRVIATVDPAGRASVFDVAPGQTATAAPTAGTPYRVELRDASGNVLERAVPAANAIHVEGRAPGMLLDATVPASAAAAAVVVTRTGSEVARRARSSHAPRASLRAPRSGSRVGRARTTLVRWSAHDADGDRLTATIDYSADAGRHWSVVRDAVRGRSARVRSAMLSASSRGRLRVRVSDGFDVATATSRRLRTVGAPPRVRIIGAHGGRVRADATLLLRGAAFDDLGRALVGRRLRWFVDKRPVARGELLTLRGLPVGAKHIRLVATDRRGRSTRAVLRVRVAGVAPSFRVARAPLHVSPRARSVRLTVASTVPALLRIAGARHRINRTPHTITIAIRPGRSTLRLAYSLRGRGGTTRGIYVLTR